MTSNVPWLVVGLGNPEPEYAGTRHNLGWLVAETLARHMDVPFGPGNEMVTLTEWHQNGQRVLLAKPKAGMNDSGGVVNAIRLGAWVPVERIIVVHDELDLPFGRVRLKRGGTTRHNGLRSITDAVGNNDYLRVRCGIGRPADTTPVLEYVLGEFAAAERSELPSFLWCAAGAVDSLISMGLELTQNVFHPGEVSS